MPSSCSADVWEVQKRAKDREQIAGVHVRVETKPFDLDEVCDLIARLLSAPQALAPKDLAAAWGAPPS